MSRRYSQQDYDYNLINVPYYTLSGAGNAIPDPNYLHAGVGYGYQQPTYFGSPASNATASPASSSAAAFSPVLPYLTPEPAPKPYKAARRSSQARRPSVSFAIPQALGDFVDSGLGERPAYSIKSLCEAAIKDSKKGRLTLNEICEVIQERFPYYRSPDNAKRLRNSARHDLSIDSRFVNHNRTPLDPGRGKYWSLDDSLAVEKLPKGRKLSATPFDFASPVKPSKKAPGSVQRRVKSNSISFSPYGHDDPRYYTTYYAPPVIQPPNVPSYLYYPSP